MERIMIVGAGRTGRGFLARLAAEAGVPVLFADKNASLLDELEKARQNGGYRIRFYGDQRMPVQISDYEVLKDTIPEDVSLILVSVGSSHLEEAGLWLMKILPTDRPMYIITSENAVGPAKRLEAVLNLPNVHVSEAAVFCTTDDDPEGRSCDILSEDYPYLPFDGKRIGDYVPFVPSFLPEEDFDNLLLRKIYTYNAASGIIAYMGALYGYTDYAKAANDPRILTLLDKNYAATNRAICKEFGIPPKEQEEFALLSRKKFTNPAITDTIERNAREPQRKLGPQERILGPMKLLHRQGEDISVLVMTAAAALLYKNPAEETWTAIQQTNTPHEILEKYGQLQDRELIDRILAALQSLQMGIRIRVYQGGMYEK